MHEVDFYTLMAPEAFMLLKSNDHQGSTSDSLKGLKLFGEDYPEAKLHLIYTGKHKMYPDSITAIPFVEALQALPEILK